MTATARPIQPSREEQRLRRIIEVERTATSTAITRARSELRLSRDTAKGLGYEQVRASKERLRTYQREFTAALDRIDVALVKAEQDAAARLLTDFSSTSDPEVAVARGVEAAWLAMWLPGKPPAGAPTEEENPLFWCQVRAAVLAATREE